MRAAVITADIVNSTQLSKPAFRKVVKQLTDLLQPYQFEFFRGDSFQVLLKTPSEALRLLLQLRASAIKWSTMTTPADVRASIGIGNAKRTIKDLKTASDEVFVLSGRAFDKLEKEERLTIVCNEKNKAVNLGLEVLAQFADYIFQRLTAKQAAVVLELLSRRTQTEAAKKLKKSQATVHKHAQAARWPEIQTLLASYENFVELIES